MRSHRRRPTYFSVILSCALATGLLATGATSQERPLYVEGAYSTRILGGEEDTRLGRAHYDAGDYGLAERHYRNAVSINRHNIVAWIGLAASYDRLRRRELAERAYRQAIGLGGNSYVILNNRAFARMERGEYAAARRLLLRAQRLAPWNPIIENNIALLNAGNRYFFAIMPSSF